MTIEIFYMNEKDMRDAGADSVWVLESEAPGIPAEWAEPGWYWWHCEPGCLPDSEPEGPFARKRDAAEDAYGGDPAWMAIHVDGEYFSDRDQREPGEGVTVSIVGDECGELEPDEARYRPLGWLNSARVTTDPDDDAVHCAVSVGDLRGAFVMTVRRKPDGTIIIHLPHPGEGFPHMETRQDHPGALVCVATEPTE